MIRRLGPEDAARYRTLRLEALWAAPTAFGASAEDEAAQPLDRFAARLATSVVLGALEEGRLVGIGGWYGAAGRKLAHVGHVFGVWVTPAARRRGHARALVAELVGSAAEAGLVCLRLRVTAGNDGARALYRAAGFTVYATERAALCVDATFLDEYLMERFLETP